MNEDLKKYIWWLLLLIFMTVAAISLFGCSAEINRDVCETRDHIWKNGIIPFKFNENVPEYHRNLIYKAIEHFEQNTPVVFRENFTDDFFLLEHGVLIKYTGENSVNSSFYPYGQGEYISDLRIGGERFFDIKTAIHELGHVVGLPHEHQRADRDEYIIINWDNIPENWHGNFRITEIDFKTPYDPNSVMGYDPYAITLDRETPSVEMEDGREIHRSTYLTPLDIAKINELYCSQIQ